MTAEVVSNGVSQSPPAARVPMFEPMPKGKRRKYTEEEQIAAVRAATASGDIVEWCEHNNLHSSRIHKWKKALKRKLKEPAKAAEVVSPVARGKELAATRAEVMAKFTGRRGETTELAEQYGVARQTVNTWKATWKKSQRGPLDNMTDEEVLQLDADRKDEAGRGRTMVANLRERISQLELENKVLKVNMQLAIKNGFFTMFDVDGFFGSKKGR